MRKSHFTPSHPLTTGGKPKKKRESSKYQRDSNAPDREKKTFHWVVHLFILAPRPRRSQVGKPTLVSVSPLQFANSFLPHRRKRQQKWTNSWSYVRFCSSFASSTFEVKAREATIYGETIVTVSLEEFQKRHWIETPLGEDELSVRDESVVVLLPTNSKQTKWENYGNDPLSN